MSGLGTDMLALTCILGGAAVGGVATMALMESRGEVDTVVTEIRCVQERVKAPRVIVTSGRSERTVVVHSSSRSPVATCDAVMPIRSGARVTVRSPRVDPVPSADRVAELERRLAVAREQRAALSEQREAIERVRAQLREAELAVETVRVQVRERERVRR